jgi:hypothetical protein
MKIPVDGGRITAGFDDPRPLSNPGQHVHGALDIAGGDFNIRSPCDGIARAFAFFRSPGEGWSRDAENPAISSIPFRDYWQDIYGGMVTIVEAKTGRLHIMTHLWPSKLTVYGPFRSISYMETAAKTRFPAHMIMTEKAEVKRGDQVGRIGSAGYSTGPHLHWEVHNLSFRLDAHAARVRPEEYIL